MTRNIPHVLEVRESRGDEAERSETPFRPKTAQAHLLERSGDRVTVTPGDLWDDDTSCACTWSDEAD